MAKSFKNDQFIDQKIMRKELVKNKNIFFLVEEKINYEFKKFVFYAELVFSYFCYLTGALTVKMNREELLEKIKNPICYFHDEIEYEEQLTSEEIYEQYFKKLKKYHENIIESIQKIDNYLYTLLNDKEFGKQLNKIKNTNFSANFNIFNNFYSPSLTKTIKNISKNLHENFIKNEKIYSLYLKKLNCIEIIKEVYGEKYVEKEEIMPYFVNKIYQEQTILEQAITISQFITKLEKNDYLLWLKNTYNIMKKS